jgi:hypothetical protein
MFAWQKKRHLFLVTHFLDVFVTAVAANIPRPIAVSVKTDCVQSVQLREHKEYFFKWLQIGARPCGERGG